MNDPARQIERAAEQLVRVMDSANNNVAELIEVIQQIEQLAAAADQIDLRRAIMAKSDINRLQSQVRDLQNNLRRVDRELSDTESKLRKALY